MGALLPEAAAIIKNSNTIAPALGSTLQATMDCSDISGRTLNRLRHVICSRGGKGESETYRRLADYLEQLTTTSGGAITDCQLNCAQVGIHSVV